MIDFCFQGASLVDHEHGYVEASAPPAEGGIAGGVEQAKRAVEAVGYVPILDVGAACVLAEAILRDCDGCSWHFTYAIVASVVSLVFSIAHALLGQQVTSLVQPCSADHQPPLLRPTKRSATSSSSGGCRLPAFSPSMVLLSGSGTAILPVGRACSRHWAISATLPPKT